MPNFYVWDNISAKLISRKIPWGWTGEELYFSINLAKTWFERTILAPNKIEMPNLYVGDHLCTKFIPRKVCWGWTGEEPYFWVNFAQTWFEWTILARKRIEMPNLYVGDHLFIPKRILGDELVKNPISWSIWPKLELNRPFWH